MATIKDKVFNSKAAALKNAAGLEKRGEITRPEYEQLRKKMDSPGVGGTGSYDMNKKIAAEQRRNANNGTK